MSADTIKCPFSGTIVEITVYEPEASILLDEHPGLVDALSPGEFLVVDPAGRVVAWLPACGGDDAIVESGYSLYSTQGATTAPVPLRGLLQVLKGGRDG